MCKRELKEDEKEDGEIEMIPIIQETPHILNPFIQKLDLSSNYDKFKLLFMTIFILPIRVVGVCLSLLLAYILSCIGLYGMTRERLASEPMTGYRAIMKTLVRSVLRGVLFFSGFHRVHVIGKQANSKEAPMLAVAPHSSFFDTLPVLLMGAPTVVAKGETAGLPFLAKFIDYTQPIYVYREDPDSRQNTIQEIRRRAKSDQDWPQIMIFPEGTCTNRTCLMTFKPGAFIPGVPVQPIVLRYPNKTDSLSWTFEGSGALRNIWVTLCQFHNYCEIEYLPVYRPNEDEKNDPYLFARNVRQVMADALRVPVVDYSFDDIHLASTALEKKLPSHVGLVEFQMFKDKYGLNSKMVADEILNRFAEMASSDGRVTLKAFAHYLKLPMTEPSVVELFNLYDVNGYGFLSFRDYLLGYCEHAKPSNTDENLRYAFRFFDASDDGYITLESLSKALKEAFDFNKEESLELFQELDPESRGTIAHDEFVLYAHRKPDYAKIFTLYRKSLKDGTRERILKSLADKVKAE